MTESNFSHAVEALRKNDHDAFIAQIESTGSAAELLHRTNEEPYANWFSGVGATLLQMTAFLRPNFAPALIERGATIDLHSACALGDVNSINRILTEDPRAIDRQIDTYYPIQFALRHPPVLRTLLERADNANRPVRKIAWFEWEDQAADGGLSDWRLIHMLALGRGNEPHIEAAYTLKEFGADLNAAASPFGEMPIHLAAIYDRTHLIRWFVENGVDVEAGTAESVQNAANTDLFDATPFAPFHAHRQTALMLALGEGQTDAVNLLLDLGANVNAADSVGFTPLHYAAGAFWKENPANVELLIERGARLDAVDALGRRSIDLARDKGYQTTGAILQRA